MLMTPPSTHVADHDPDSLSCKLNEDLQRVAEWIDVNGMKMNVGKTQLMVLSRKHSRV